MNWKKMVAKRGLLVLLLGMYMLLSGCNPDQTDPGLIFDPSRALSSQLRSLTGDKITLEENHIVVDFAENVATSTIDISPEKGVWDASAYRFVRCEIKNLGREPQLVELGFGGYDLTLGATMVPPGAQRVLKAVIYRTDHPAYMDTLFPVMHGKPDGILRGWMASTSDSIGSVQLIFPEVKMGASVAIGRIWLEESYELLTEAELKKKFYPMVDSFGQFMHHQWPGKIKSLKNLKDQHARESMELQQASSDQWNRFGGWNTGPQLESTGRFRVEKIDGKWWFVDPDGRLFWSHGIDCVEFGTQTSTRISDREHYFLYLPEDNAPGEELYRYTRIDGDSVRWISFHALNLYRTYGSSWREVSKHRIHDRFKNWGINTIGNWSNRDLYLLRKTPYVLTAYTSKTGLIADPYAAGFKEDLISNLKGRTEECGDPWCLGIFVDNELKWGVKWAAKIPEQILTAPTDQPAKIQFVSALQHKYRHIDRLNQSWGSSFTDWAEVLGNTLNLPGAGGDLREFMKSFTSLYYSTCREAVKTVDPDMLYLGCRMDFHLYPEDTSLNYIIKIAAEYCDVVSFNRYRYTCSELLPPDGGDYPIIIGEFHFGTLETGLLQPGLKYAANQEERAELYRHYVSSALENPYLVGTHWFQLVDQAVTGRRDGENYQAGFLTVGDVPQKEIIQASRELGRQMYRRRYR